MILKHLFTYTSRSVIYVIKRKYDELAPFIRRLDPYLEKINGIRNKSTNEVNFFNNLKGAKIYFKSLNKGDIIRAMYGEEPTLVIMDEITDWEEDYISPMYSILRTTSKDIKIQLLSTFNPRGVGHAWIKRRYIENAKPFEVFVDPISETTRVFIPALPTDNKILMENDPGYIKRIKASGTSEHVAALLDGDWSSPDGSFVKSIWFEKYNNLNYNDTICVHSWDTASKEGQYNDPSACTVWRFQQFGNKYYLDDIVNEKFNTPDLKKKIIQMAERDKPFAILIEDASSGIGIIQSLQAETRLPVVAITPIKSKGDRLLKAAILMETGKVAIRNCHWTLDYEVQLTTFPNAKHDDLCDSTSQFLIWANENYSSTFNYKPIGEKRNFENERTIAKYF